MFATNLEPTESEIALEYLSDFDAIVKPTPATVALATLAAAVLPTICGRPSQREEWFGMEHGVTSVTDLGKTEVEKAIQLARTLLTTAAKHLREYWEKSEEIEDDSNDVDINPSEERFLRNVFGSIFPRLSIKKLRQRAEEYFSHKVSQISGKTKSVGNADIRQGLASYIHGKNAQEREWDIAQLDIREWWRLKCKNQHIEAGKTGWVKDPSDGKMKRVAKGSSKSAGSSGR